MKSLFLYQIKYALKTRSFYVILILTGCFSAISVLILQYGTNLIPPMGDMIESADGVPTITSTAMAMYGADALISGIGDALITLIPLFIAIFVSSDFSEGTIRNILTRGYSKTQFYFSKLIVGFVVAAILIIVSAGIQTGLSSLFWGFDNGVTVLTRVLLIFLVKVFSVFALVSFCVFISFLFRRTNGLAVVANIIVIRFAPFILTSLASIMKKEIDVFSRYEITTIISSLPEASSCSNQTLFHAVLFSIIYLVISTLVGLTYFRRKDL